MLNAYVISPKDLSIHTKNTPTLSPLAFSASQINPHTDMPYGLIAVKGSVYVGSPEELPVFVRYADGRADILDKPYSDDVAHSDFVISGTSILVMNNQPVNTTGNKHLRTRDSVKRVVIGLLEDGNVFVVFCTATINKLKTMLCAYGVSTALLISSDSVYFSNPRGGIEYGERPITTIHATYYEEVPTPIIAIDPAHGGNDLGKTSRGLNEKDLTLTISKEMQSYLKENYYGTFILTRSDDTLSLLWNKSQFVSDTQADLVYSCHINSYDGITRGIECFYDTNASDSTKALVSDIHTRMANLVSVHGIPDNGLHPKQLSLFEVCSCPTFVAKLLYLDNAEDAHLLEKPEMLRMLGRAQGEALAQALGLNKRVRNTRITKQTFDKSFRVNVGQFQFKLGAMDLCERLRQCGFDAYITRE